MSAAFGGGAIPPITDHEALGRIEDWLLDLPAPSYPFAIDHALAEQGKPIYAQYCASCHGASGTDFSGDRVGHVEPIDKIGTDRWRLDSYTHDLAVNQGNLYTGDERYRFKRFRKTFGYANMPLDGIWLRAPYLHNGSVPTLRDLLEPQPNRPVSFYRGNDLYDPVNVGFVTHKPRMQGRPLFLLDTRVDGNGNGGHEGYEYGTELSGAGKNSIG